MVQDHIHGQIVKHLDEVKAWFSQHRKDLYIPFYSSYDVRDSGFKVANVDANIYPAGFNNICVTDREHTGDLVKQYIENHYGPGCRKLLVLTEEHTNNAFYWENVRALKSIIVDSGLEVRVAVPRVGSADGVMMMKTSTGDEVEVFSALIVDGEVSSPGYKPDLVISNNDFSEFYAEWGDRLKTPMNPPRELGWYQRKKSTYFKYYNQLAAEFAQVIDVDPWMFTVETEWIEKFDPADDAIKEQIAKQVDAMLVRISEKYAKLGIDQKPFVFIKNNSGTYGLAVMRVGSGDEFRSMNYKSRKKMKAAKGGRDVEEVILQEGIPSATRADGVTAEPAVYLLGCQLAGGFLRTHAEKDPTESLNSPGAVYKRMCVSDLNVSVEGHPMENVYGWVAKLGLLAIGLETRSMNVTYANYQMRSC